MAEAPKNKVSVKHVQIDKNQSQMLAVVAAAVVLTIFSLVATKGLVTKGLYQRRALAARHAVVATLKSNYTAAQTLKTQYDVFAQQNPNLLGGTTSNTDGSSNDGNNPQIVLDALPSTYDAPALATTLEKILTDQSFTINSLTVTDDPTSNSDQPQAQPVAKAIVFQFEATKDYAGGRQLLQDFERSIRPFDLNTIELSGTDTELKLTVGMTTYFQPARSLDLSATKVVK